MSIHVALNHVTDYHYDHAVELGPQIVRLRPAPHCRTRILSYSLKVLPEGHLVNWQQDPQGNYLARLVFPEKTRRLRIEVDLLAEMAVFNPFDFFLEPYAQTFPFSYGSDERHELAPYLEQLPVSPRFAAYVETIERTSQPTVAFLVQLNQRISQDVRYLTRMEPGVQAPEQTLALGCGSCRDSAWLLVQVLRELGLAARFVSGYLIQLAADVDALDGPAGSTVDSTDLHAWCEVYLPGAGWVGLDATSGMLAGQGHIPLACSPTPTSAAPITGRVEPCECELVHSMSVRRLWEAPRVTQPYSEAQWNAIVAVGERIDADLQASDVNLAMGAQLTFVSIDHPDAAEWKTAILGPGKRTLAAELCLRLRDRYAPGSLLHVNQGKGYPIEPVPVWSMKAFWRMDGEPLWRNPQLIAEQGRDDGAGPDLAARFLARVAERLGLVPDLAFPAFEDSLYYLWREGSFPENLSDARLADALERERLRAVLTQGLDRVLGYVLPLARTPLGTNWHSDPWPLRGGRCRLLPGEAALGHRLPLASAGRLGDSSEAQTSESPGWQARTALCAQPREGRLYIFMPRLERLEDYLELVGVVEAVAEALGCPVGLEGYEPPADPRLQSLRITPGPGVIQVQMQPSASWAQLVDRTEALYEQARLTHLASERFMVDGRHASAGGGSHVLLGGAGLAASPFLRRPDLLRSLVSYWNDHPALSYLFSGLAIGPRSKAPRVDETRSDALHELEVAFAQLPAAGEEGAHWRVDHLLRPLLADVAGDNHRAEFCIDPLHSGERAHKPLGLLALQGFEMPPHARMALAQQLLVRGLVARFWRAPYAPQRLTRWGTVLHDRCLLPHFIAQDLADVLHELDVAGYPFKADWFAAQLEFRFPKVGDHAIAGIELELRQALEPWQAPNGRDATGGSLDYPDVWLERLQVKVTGMVPQRYVLTCNGLPVPLHPTGQAGEYVAGVRYRAWQPDAVVAPGGAAPASLVFDLVDTSMQRSLGGCQYHVAHPGGQNHRTVPVNGNEAESRRLARFFRLGHTPGTLVAPPVQRNDSFPMTLDLRLFR